MPGVRDRQDLIERLGRFAIRTAPLALLAIPPELIERYPAPCLSRLLFKRRCPGCGMTRAISCAMHGRFRAAWRHNPRVVVVLPLLAILWIREVR